MPLWSPSWGPFLPSPAGHLLWGEGRVWILDRGQEGGEENGVISTCLQRMGEGDSEINSIWVKTMSLANLVLIAFALYLYTQAGWVAG